mgnify:CR=1 FL=1
MIRYVRWSEFIADCRLQFNDQWQWKIDKLSAIPLNMEFTGEDLRGRRNTTANALLDFGVKHGVLEVVRVEGVKAGFRRRVFVRRLK